MKLRSRAQHSDEHSCKLRCLIGHDVGFPCRQGLTASGIVTQRHITSRLQSSLETPECSLQVPVLQHRMLPAHLPARVPAGSTLLSTENCKFSVFGQGEHERISPSSSAIVLQRSLALLRTVGAGMTLSRAACKHEHTTRASGRIPFRKEKGQAHLSLKH